MQDEDPQNVRDTYDAGQSQVEHEDHDMGNTNDDITAHDHLEDGGYLAGEEFDAESPAEGDLDYDVQSITADEYSVTSAEGSLNGYEYVNINGLTFEVKR